MSLRAGILSRGRFTYRGRRGGNDHVQGTRARTSRSRAALSRPHAATAHRSPLIMAVTSDDPTQVLPRIPRQGGPPSVEREAADAVEVRTVDADADAAVDADVEPDADTDADPGADVDAATDVESPAAEP